MNHTDVFTDKPQTVADVLPENTLYKPERFWSYACVFGSLWGALELTLGTFLHTLHVPKTGLMMVSLSLILLLAQRSIYPLRGSTLAAGVIAACIKSLSPGGIVLGPMVGILSEALIVELCLLAQPRGLFSSVLAGSLAVLWSQLHSVFKLWVYYGKDFIDVFIRLVEKFFRVEWSMTLGWALVAAFVGLVMSLGGLSGFIGWRWGRRASRELQKLSFEGDLQADQSLCPVQSPQTDMPIRSTLLLNASQIDAASELAVISLDSSALSATDSSRTDGALTMPEFARKPRSSKRALKVCESAIRTRRFVFPVAVITLIMQLGGELWLSVPALLIFAGVLFLAARPVILSLWWPRFWAFSLGVSLFGGLVLAWQIEGHIDFMIGAEASARMFTRGFYVFALITWATRCVRSSEILNLWDKLGMPRLGIAIKEAYALLPAWLDQFNGMLTQRPKGFRANARYIKECVIVCLIEASRQARDS